MARDRERETGDSNLVGMVTEVVAAYVGNNKVETTELPDVIKSVHDSFASILDHKDEQTSQKPAVAIKKSFTDDYIICLEDGRKLKMLKRYLRTHYDMSPEDYRAKWGLPPNYPMVAPSYAAQRSEFAIKNGLGKSKKGE